ncbi:alpha/beta fold hydrolase [Muricauda sp. 2012CJ35-5]|uniref:Alpha/beta fold hydrolase n=1 Tax=Flagellimonas spongiicola TaxID=2942208 RepID=A0ABT0PSZ6_9FLAO|nr:alpha/beta fold hydrolase [Allomuricauda spongiicola]MCL6274512.1 alpha/beta fold hydrolase [Allomuricauda spongiicola]
MPIKRKINRTPCYSSSKLLFWFGLFSLSIIFSVEGNAQKSLKVSTGKSETDSIIDLEFQFPENWQIADSRKITVPLRIYKSPNNSIFSTPIFWLSGGPGMTNMDYKPSKELLENHDVFLVGYRGVDGEIQLNCPEISNALRGNTNNLLSKKSVRNVQHAATICSERLLKKGIDLNGYTIEQTLMDIDAVRQHYGFHTINLLSGSYGTRLAQFYMKQYGEHVEHTIMIGASPPGRFVWEPKIIEQKLADYDRLCQSNPYCSAQTGNLSATFDQVLNNLPKRWLFFEIDPGKVKVATFGMLYHTHSATQVIDAYLAAAKGDYSGIALLSMAHDYIIPEMMNWGDFLSKGMIDYDPTRSYHNEFSTSKTALGSPISALLMDIGKSWPTDQPKDTYTELDTLYTRILVINGALDFSTPHQVVQEELMPFLKNGELKVIAHKGHVADLLYKKEVIGLMADFYADKNVINTTLNYPGPSFELSMGFPKLMKLGIALMLFLVFLLLFLLYRFVWKKNVIKRPLKRS